MLQCGKCGKIYSYDKFNGICPACGRYNRENSASLERDLHRRYDRDNSHSADYHARVHNRNYDNTSHSTGESRRSDDATARNAAYRRMNQQSQQTGANGFWGANPSRSGSAADSQRREPDPFSTRPRQTKSTRDVMKANSKTGGGFVLFRLLPILVFLLVFFSFVSNNVGDFGLFLDNTLVWYEEFLDSINVESSDNCISIEEVYLEYLGIDLSHIEWSDFEYGYYVDEDEVAALEADDGTGAYYLLSVEICNFGGALPYFDEIREGDVCFFSEDPDGEYYETNSLLNFHTNHSAYSTDLRGYINYERNVLVCILYLPDGLIEAEAYGVDYNLGVIVTMQYDEGEDVVAGEFLYYGVNYVEY